MSAVAIGAIWPVHLGFPLTRWGLHVGWSFPIAKFAGIIGLATGAGYTITGVICAGLWLTSRISRDSPKTRSQWTSAAAMAVANVVW